MKKLTILLTLLFTLSGLNQWADAAVKVRPYGTIGGTVIELPGVSDWDTVKSGGGGQFFYEAFPGFCLGVDLAFIHSYYYQVSYGYDVNYLNLLGVFEYQYGILILQVGLGPYFGVGINDNSPFGTMYAGGVDIPVNEMLSIALLVRFDVVFEDWYNGDGVTFMPSFMAGLSVKF